MNNSYSDIKSAWVSKSKKGRQDKPWGYENFWSGFSGVHGKTVFIKAAHRSSLKFNKVKTEVLYIMSGKARVTYGNERSLSDPIQNPMIEDILDVGDSLLVQSGCPYRIEAIEDCLIIEIGNCSSDKPVRIEDDYGRV
jgi:mannose-6-phosphate isomerase-like protein (cupin superfamily)